MKEKEFLYCEVIVSGLPKPNFQVWFFIFICHLIFFYCPIILTFQLVTVDSEVLLVNSWKALADKLIDCRHPLENVAIDRIELDEQAMNFFQSVHPICFSGRLVFNQIVFSELSFKKLFNRMLKPNKLWFNGISGVKTKFFSNAMGSYSAFVNTKMYKMVGGGPKIKNVALIEFLHGCEVERGVCIQVDSLQDGMEELVNRLFEV